MVRALLDASVLIAAFNKQDVHHEKAREILSGSETLAFTDHVFDEVVGVLSRKLNKQHACIASRELLLSNALLLFTTQEEFYRAYERFSDAVQLSFTDCCLLETTRSMSASLYTFDKALEQAYKN